MVTPVFDHVQPNAIEARSFALIAAELPRPLDPVLAPIIMRVIHTTADFDYVDTLTFSPGAVDAALDALRQGADIVTDTAMAQAGINKAALSAWGGNVHCYMADPDVAAAARRDGTTRAAAAMDKAASLPGPLIFAIGNAPTALVRLHALIEANQVHPALVIGVPVGFVNVVPAKELFLAGPTPHIVARGRKGGSPVAAAICNALLYQL
jgi:precorrin-8X/cobalt-precorrin-8 methylmutase